MNFFTNTLFFPQEGDGEGDAAAAKGPAGPSASDLQDQLSEQEKMIMQFKEMIRENEETIRKRDHELKVTIGGTYLKS